MKDAYYFSHDSNAKDDPKCVLLIEQLGLEGYGIYWVLIELLREQPEYRYPIALLPAMARRYNTTSEKMKTVVMSYGLFQVENDEFFTQKVKFSKRKPSKNRIRMYELDVRKWYVLRDFIFKRDGYTCQYCGERGGKLEADHKIPFSRGGTDEQSNLVTCCRKCNRQKHDKTSEEFMKWKARKGD